jgi:anti-anti-sigma regulatory factor
MPYHVSLMTTSTQQRYQVRVVDDLDGATARQLGDWLDAARMNPSASFEIDLSEARHVDPRALQRLLSRHDALRSERRLDVVGDPHPLSSRVAALLPVSAVVLAEPLFMAAA